MAICSTYSSGYGETLQTNSALAAHNPALAAKIY